LKTPLTTIIGYSNLLLTAPHDEQMEIKALTYIRQEGKRMEMLSRKLMALIRYQQTDLEKKEIDMRELVERVHQSALPLALQKSIRLETASDGVCLNGDADLLHTLCLNLVDNAIKASAEGGAVTLKAERSALLLTIAVEDHGIGIPPDEVARVKEPFYIVDKARTRASNGAGLGLSICSAIAQAHDAVLKIESRLGEGTIVSVEFRL
jgi:signal transduction histidine kinase